MLQKKMLTFISILLIFSFILVGCQPATTTPEEATSPAAEQPAVENTEAVPATTEPVAEEVDPRLKTLVVAIDSDPAGLEPGTNKAYPIGSEIILNIFDTLVAWKAPDFTELEGRLAESWVVSDDGLVYTFKLREGVLFHDGTPFNAEAVKFSFERTLEINPYMTTYFSHITDMTVVDPMTIQMTLDASLPVFLSWLAMPQSAIVSPTAVEKYGEDFNINPVGTGPFTFVSYVPDTEVVLNANEDYFRGRAKLDSIVFRVIPDASTRRLELENGTIDLSQQNGQISSVPVEDIKAFADNESIEVVEVPSQIIRQFEFNNSNPDSPVNDIRVRQAMCYAIDYDGLVNGLLGGTANRVYGPLTTNSWGYNPEIENSAFTYDPEKARQLLTEAGYGENDLNFTMYTFQGSLWGDISTLLQANFADVGINVEIAQTEFPIYRELQTKGEFDIALDGRQPWYNDPDAHITIGYLSSLKDTAMTFRMPENAELDAKILEAQSTINQDDRKALYYDIQKELLDYVPGCYLFSNKIIIFKNVNVKGLVTNSAPPLNEYWSVYKE
jgi:peptide/nickel transport system substrate-binding protein